MSQENVENFRRAVDAFNRRDVDAFVALASPDVEWEDAIFWSEGSRTYRGREALREWFAEVIEPWDSSRAEIDEIVEASEGRLLDGMTLTARGKGSGVETQLHFWQSTGSRMARPQRVGISREGRGPRSRRAVGVGQRNTASDDKRVFAIRRKQ